MTNELLDARKKTNKLLAELSNAQARVRDEKASLAAARQRQADAEAAQAIVQELAQKVQQEAHERIAGVVTRCLEAVFDNPYKFRIRFDRKRGRTEAALLFVRNGHELSPSDGSGGGVLDVASFALRLASLVLVRPRLRRLVVLDEPFKHLDAGKSARVSEMLQTLAEELDVQFVMVTHSTQLQTGKVIKL